MPEVTSSRNHGAGAPLTMSQRLAVGLNKWAQRFEFLDEEVAKDPNAAIKFTDMGRFLAAELKLERPELTVIFFDHANLRPGHGQPRAEFEYEITAEMAKELVDRKHFPGGDYMHAACDQCQTLFYGPKRQYTCQHCHMAWVAPLQAQTVMVFAAEQEGGLPGVDADLLPEGVGLIRALYLAGSTRLVGLVTHELTDDQMVALAQLGQQCGARLLLIRENEDGLCKMAFSSSGQIAMDALRGITGSIVKGHSFSGDRLRPLSTAPRDGTPVLLRYRLDMSGIRAGLEDFAGIVFVGRNRLDHGGTDDWGFAAPMGYGGIPDEWLMGWATLAEGIDVQGGNA